LLDSLLQEREWDATEAGRIVEERFGLSVAADHVMWTNLVEVEKTVNFRVLHPRID